MMMAGDRIVHWLLDAENFPYQQRATPAANFRAKVLLHEGSAHYFGGFVQKLEFCTAGNGYCSCS
jgi:hypothetical protein